MVIEKIFVEPNIFVELSIIIIIAVIITSLTRILKQPIIIGYIITGILISPSLLNVIKSAEIILTFSELGVAILLFTVGLNLNPKVIKEVGKVSLITGIGQALFTAVIGYFIGIALGFSPLTSLYIAVALTFSSTIIIAKLLSDKGDLHKLYGKIAIGFLIVQDIIAMLALMVVSSFSNGNNPTNFALTTFATGTALFVGLFAISYLILPKITKPIAKSTEFLLLFSLGWCLAIAALFNLFNFSIEIGALLAGITLSLSPYRFEISSRLKPIRDFFVFLFFIWIGTQIIFTDVAKHASPIIIFSLLILIGNPLIMMILIGALKYKKRTGFLAGLVGAQTSEFSHILIVLGVKIGHLAPDIITLITVVGIITIGGSSYFISYGDKIYPHIARYLSVFERKSAKEDKEKEQKDYDIILFGSHKTGHYILDAFKNKKQELLVVDHNPEIVEKINSKGFNCVYGDISDIDLLDEIDLRDAKMVISTVPDLDTNILFIKRVRLCNKKAIILVVANSVEESFALYKNGATYVITPKFIGGEYISNKIRTYQFDIKKYIKEKEQHIQNLRKLKD